MQDGLSARVAGSSTIFPRGYLWQAPVWYAIAAAWLALSRWPPLWFRMSAVAGLLGATLTFLAVVSSVSINAFTADETGVWLGLPPYTRRRGCQRLQNTYLPWQQIERVRMRVRPGGVRLEFILNSSANAKAHGQRYSPAERAWRWLLLLVPFWYLRRPTALMTPLDGPPRYEVTVRGKTIDEMRISMRALAPREVTVAVLVRKK
jgi:hypothetical protein